MYLCLCKGMREHDIEALVVQHGACLEAIKQAMEWDESCCGRCEHKLEAMIRDSAASAATDTR